MAELEKTGLDYEIIPAVDGRELDLTDRATIDPVLLERTPFPEGTAGCALSHLNIYRKVVAEGLDKVLILEDDVMLPADLGSLAEAVADQLTGAELALLSCDSPDPCQMSVAGSVQLPHSRLLALPINVTQPKSSGAYVISGEACERMIKCITPVQVSIDDWWHFYREGALDRIRCISPIPVLKDPKFVSTIGFRSLGNGIRARLVRPLVDRKVPIVYQALTYRRQRIFEQWGRSELVEAPFIEKPSRLD